MGVPYAEVIGDPIAHSKSPLIHKFWLEKLGIEGDYRATRVSSRALSSYFDARRRDPDWRGCNITMPHKRAIWSLLADGGFEARDAAVNCVTPIAGGYRFRNFDVDALLQTIPFGRGAVAVLGAGGAAAAAVEALMSRTVIVLARNAEKGRGLAHQAMEYGWFASLARATPVLRKVEGLINATPLGMVSQPQMPEEILRGLESLSPGAFVYDMVYDPAQTRLLERAEELELVTIDGLTMLIEQASLSFAAFFGAPAARSVDAELRELLTQ